MPSGPAASDVGSGVSGPLVERLLATHPASRERFLCGFLQDELKVLSGRDEAPDPLAPIIDDEMDSLLIVEFRDRLQSHIGARLELPATIVFDHPKISDLAAHLLASLDLASTTKSASRIETPQTDSNRDPQQHLDTMSEQQAMEALLREVND